MARLPRVVVVDVPHHVTQRGNARQVILADDADRIAYFDLLRKYSQLHSLSLLGWCLMSNHVHLIAVPRTDDGLASARESQPDLTALRRCTHTGRPLGTPDFVAALEKSMLRLLAPQKGGRPKKSSIASRPSDLFVA
jgi:REP element-mobilizing transposase RayT